MLVASIVPLMTKHNPVLLPKLITSTALEAELDQTPDLERLKNVKTILADGVTLDNSQQKSHTR